MSSGHMLFVVITGLCAVFWLLGLATGLKIGEVRGWRKALAWAAQSTKTEER